MTAPATIDFHAHYRAPGQKISSPPAWMTEQRRADTILHNEQMSSFARIVEESDRSGVDVRLLSLPASSRFHDFDTVPTKVEDVIAVNDYLADGVRDNPGRLLGLATIDTFTGEDGAREVRRAVDDLALTGIVVDSGKADVYLGVAETLPTLQEAAHLGVPVFVHPTGTGLNPVLAAHAGQLGNSYGRGLADGIALLGLINRGVLDDIPGLRIVFTTLGIGALGIAGTWRARGGLGVEDGRWEVYFDTMGFDAANIAYLVEVLGAHRVVLGSDFPHQVDATTERVANALEGAGLSAADQHLIRAGNAAKLLVRKPAGEIVVLTNADAGKSIGYTS